MTSYVALVRGINVGGKNKLPMPKLKALLEQLGHECVVTYVQSGNAVFTSAEKEAKVASDLATGIEQEFGIRVPVIVRSQAQLEHGQPAARPHGPLTRASSVAASGRLFVTPVRVAAVRRHP